MFAGTLFGNNVNVEKRTQKTLMINKEAEGEEGEGEGCKMVLARYETHLHSSHVTKEFPELPTNNATYGKMQFSSRPI